MSASDNLKRILIDTIASNINEVVFGFDGTPATSSDGSVGRPAVTVTPTITVLDTSTILMNSHFDIFEQATFRESRFLRYW